MFSIKMYKFFKYLVIFSILFLILLNKMGQKFLFLNLGDLNSLSMEMSFMLDVFASVFLTTVALISLAVFTFSFSYMSNQKFFARFHSLLSMFVFSMILLVLSSNLIFTLIGWDGLGVTSYLLVIYYGSTKSYNAGMLTMLTNRFGDVLLVSGMGMVLSQGSWSVLYYKEFMEVDMTLKILLTAGAFTKSAQIPFSAWLPAAMAAPTPVSSLVHSSTLVTAGVYLMFRHLYNSSSNLEMPSMMFVGLLTMTMASMSAFNEKDMKKMVALSTLSQLGLMILCLGSGWAFMAFFHLITHAFFKAMMFISVGNMIHSSQLYQSMKNTGGLIYSSPFNSSSVVLASASLCGAPFTAAFFSKEPIIEMSIYNSGTLNVISLVMLSLLMTLLYSSRLMKIVLLHYNSMTVATHISEIDMSLSKGILLLSIPSFSSGSVMTQLLYLKPVIFLYPLSIKLVIFTSFFVMLAVLTFNSYPVMHTGLVYLFPMWGLSLFSGPIFNTVTQYASFGAKAWGFSTPLKSFQEMVSFKLSGLSSFYSSHFVYRLIVSIPFFYMLLKVAF